MKTKKNKLTFSILSLGLIISPIFSLIDNSNIANAKTANAKTKIQNKNINKRKQYIYNNNRLI